MHNKKQFDGIICCMIYLQRNVTLTCASMRMSQPPFWRPSRAIQSHWNAHCVFTAAGKYFGHTTVSYYTSAAVYPPPHPPPEAHTNILLTLQIECDTFFFCFFLSPTDAFIAHRDRFNQIGSDLHIRKINKNSDGGVYNCVASNSMNPALPRQISPTLKLEIVCK